MAMRVPLLLAVVVLLPVLVLGHDGELVEPPPQEPRLQYDDQDPGEAAESVCPARCSCRRGRDSILVDCSNRKLTEVPVTEIPEDVEHLDLSDNAIRAVPRFLPAWERLEQLNLAGNQITDFPPSALGTLTSLELLDLSRNKIASLRHVRPDRFVVDNPVLQVLNLSGNGIQDLGHGSFQSLVSESLLVLDVSRCSVSSLDPEEALAGLPSLRTLRVSGNPLQQLPPLRAPALLELDVSACSLRAVRSQVFAKEAMPKLTHLAVSRNPDLGHFISASANDTTPWSASLQVLDAEDCSLQDLSFMAALPNLTQARLRGNRISALEPLGLLDNGALLHLDLADNKLENLPAQAFKGTELLRELDLSGNRLTAIHAETFSDHLALRVLNVSRNPLVSLKLSAPSLRQLDASHAQLQVLPEGVLDGTPHLRHLNLSNNPLPSLPSRLSSPGTDAALESLDVSFCRLEDLRVTTLRGLPHLQTADLTGNRFTDSLKEDAFAENAVLHNLQLADNPWRCECKSKDFRDFLDFLLRHPVKEDIHLLTCRSPEALQGLSWYDACLGPGHGSMASLDSWMFVLILALSVAVVAAGVLSVRRLTRGKARRRRQQQRQEQEDEWRACEEEASRRRVHRRMQLEQQEQLRRQTARAQRGSAEDPDPHPPSYEEAVLMERVMQDEEAAVAATHSSSESDSEDESLKECLVNPAGRGRVTDVIEEEEEGDEGSSSSGAAIQGNGGNGANSSSCADGSSSGKFHTKL